ncbi:AraC family transcriptional regulator [Shewanella bicestrii]|uniref:AraC family transcriptional regulator n=1 Tax=Shewanella bicestrii TaxID=2018305 RepID=A0A220UHR4_9GAMM|nr:AraC family transcriptional regulator [Shewanella bicestrii]ASK67635.1 AraC family transcriptional regulator [Shewanella bicestrii]
MIRMFEYDSKLAQSLSRVPVHQPSIIRVIQGEKSLLWQDDALAVNAEQLLLLPAGSHISFVNRPMSGRYRAVQLLLPYELPSGVMLAATDRVIPKPTQTISRSVDFAWNALLHSLTLALPTSVQMHYLAALLLSLPQQASVNWLYSHKPANVSQAVLGLLGQHPSAPWQQKDIADKLHMSTASLRRKLAQEDTSFRQLLAEVRLCQGLTLLQNSTDSVLQIALACGYLSAEKFSARFKQAFGLTPAAYRRTL